MTEFVSPPATGYPQGPPPPRPRLVADRSALALDGDDRPDAPLGTLLFRAGLVPEEELRDALESSLEDGRRLGEVLLERGLIAERDLARILAGQKGLPFVDLGDRDFDPEALRLLSVEKVHEWGALAIGYEGGVPIVAVSDPANRHVFGEVAEALGRKPRFVVAATGDLLDAIARTCGTRAPVGEAGEPDRSQPVLVADEPPRARAKNAVQVVVLLSNGERIQVASAPDAAGALAEAQALIRSLDDRQPGRWPYSGGRFLRPDAIVSVDVVEP
jgi:hypothetical protein